MTPQEASDLSLFRTKSAAGVMLLLAAFVFVAGCDLARYEERMGYQQQKLRFAEEMNQYLEAASVKVPDQASKEDLFLRPPKAIAVVAEDKLVGNLARFTSTGTNKEGIVEVWVTAAKQDNRDKFVNEVLGALKITTRTKRDKDPDPRSGSRLKFEWFHDDQGPRGTFDVFITKGSATQCAVAFRSDKPGSQSTLENALSYCISTLRLGQEARMSKGARPSTSTAKASGTKGTTK